MDADKDGEMYSGGYTGKVLRVDLSSKTFSEESPSRGDGARLHRRRRLHGQVPLRRGARRLRPARPREQLIFAPGPFTGTKIPCASRMAINAKSPLTGAMGVASPAATSQSR